MSRLAVLAVLALWLLAGNAAAQTELRIASLAPHGSAWANIMEKGNERIQKDTAGRVKIRYYFSGQQGDEKDVVRKMKLGHLDGAALTSTGLGLIQPDVLVMQLPYLFTSDKQVDHVRKELAPYFEKQFADAGYVLLSWGDVGWVHMYAKQKIETRDQLLATKAWVRADDPIAREFFSLIGMNGVALGVGEVLHALQTGTIDACSAPPLAAITLQWYTKVKFMTDRPSAYAIGALVLRKEAYDKLTADDRQLMRGGTAQMSQELTANVRRDNERAKKAMAKAGIEIMRIDDASQEKLVAAGKEVWGRLAGKVYSKEILDRVIETIARTP
jgi:TRAP-type C4-dicarboxylate transport system substrate-binding protein